MKKYYYEISIIIEVKAENIMIAEKTIKSERRFMLDSWYGCSIRTPSHKRIIGGKYTAPSRSFMTPVSKTIKRIKQDR